MMCVYTALEFIISVIMFSRYCVRPRYCERGSTDREVYIRQIQCGMLNSNVNNVTCKQPTAKILKADTR